MPEILEEDE